MMENIPYIGEIFALTTAIVWAFSVIMFRKSGETVHPIALNMFKNNLSFVLFFVAILLSGGRLLYSDSVTDYLLLIASGILGIGLSDTLFFKSLNLLGGGLSAIVSCFYSPSLIAMSMIVLGERLTPLQMVGALLVVSAILTATHPGSSGDISRKNVLLGILYGLCAMLLMAVGVVIIKPVLNRSPVMWVTEVRLVGGIISLAVVLLLRRSRSTILGTLLLTSGWKYTFTGSFFGAFVAMGLWIAGMKYTSVSSAAILNQTSNLFVFVFAALLLKEKITLSRAIGIMLAVSGVILITLSKI
jgi:drug/metabolite transporter (DMT)-like permease